MRKFNLFWVLLAFCCMAGIQAANAETEFEEIPLTKDMFHTWDGWGADAQSTGIAGDGVANYEMEIASGGIIYGSKWTVGWASYADLTGCNKMIVKGTPGMNVRTMWNREATEEGKDGDYIEWILPIGEDGIIEFDLQNGEKLKDCEYLHLNAIKLTGSITGTIESITILRKRELFDEIPLTKDMFHTWDGWGADAQSTGIAGDGVANYEMEIASGGIIYGSKWTVGWASYADLTGYNKMIVKGTPGMNVRTMWNREATEEGKDGDYIEWILPIGEDGIIEFDLQNGEKLKGCEYLHLNAIKLTGSITGTIESITILRKQELEESADDILLTKDMFKTWDGWGADAQSTGIAGDGVANYDIEIEKQGVIYGSKWTVGPTSYADLTGCNKMIVKGTPGMNVRTMWNRLQNEDGSQGTYIEWIQTIDEDSIIEFDLKSGEKLKDCEYLHLNAIKNKSDNDTCIINYIKLGDFELVVTDGKNFTPNFKIYNSATYERKFNTDYTYGTICLPFAPDEATCANYTFYKLAEVNSEALIFEEEVEPKANTAYLYKLNEGVDAEAAKIFTGGVTTISDIEVEGVGGWSFIGAFQKTKIEDVTDGLYYAYTPTTEKNILTRATNSLTVHPYRAYFKFVETGELNFTPTTATMRMIIGGQDGGANTIEEVINPEEIEGAVFDLEGRPVEKMQKGQIYIVGGKKVMK